MGLGKTLQSIALLAYLKSARSSKGPFLVICPLSVTEGWALEMARFAPHLRVLRYVGNKEEREELRQKICEHVNEQAPQARANPELPFDVLLTTYELAMADVTFLSRMRWCYAIVDEAQRLKNANSVLYKTLDEQYMLPRRLLLTGTPVQNNLTELWALLHFCMPLVFGDLEGFLDVFGPAAAETHKDSDKVADTEDSRLAMLREIVKSFMLRRTKAALVHSKALVLPPLSEVTIFSPMANLQKHVYVSVLKKESPKLVGDNSGPTTSLQNIVMQLRKACSHPYLFDGVEPEPFQEGEHIVEASGKLKMLDMMLKKLHAGGHRVLIFAQMTRTLDILQDYLEYRRYSYERLDGSVRAEERFDAVRSFSADHSKRGGAPSSGSAFVFLLTTRAGGVGLNLVAADTVIFYEQDWNPQADKQALQRAHRMGQMSPVLAINLITPHTIEEVIMRRAKRKLELTYNVIGRDDVDLEAHGPASAGSADLRSMIMFGVNTLHKSGDTNDVEIVNDSALEAIVDAALAQRGKTGSDLSSSTEFGNVGLVTLDSQGDQAENFYKYEGKDFTKPADKALLESWAVDANASKGNEVDTRRSRRGRTSALGSDEDQENARAQKRQKAEDKKRSKWQSLGYHSLAIDDPGVGLQPDSSDDETGNDVNFVIGDCTQPVTTTKDEPCIILSFVDNSGTWGRGGMFDAVARLSSKVPEAYEAAYEAEDLHLDDLHLIPVSGATRFVGVAVIQTYDRRRKIPRSDISMSAFETCLRKVVTAAKAHSASVHVPRIGSRGAQGKNEWYSVERLLRKYATSYNVPFYVYYYRRS
ncbi:hypothetical protein M758_2G239400 [Ceratodon purpureus]|nr:hypothetical protein M758_2G239400 [Ceratodon purpureus]